MVFPVIFLILETLVLLAFQQAGKLPFRYLPVLIISSLLQLLLIQHSQTYSHSIDLFDHLDYLNYVYHNFAMPDPTGWRLQQPPLYYYYLAVCLKILDAFHVNDPIPDLRYFSHLLYVIYAVYVVRIIESQKILPSVKLLCVITLIFWPSIQFSAVRINNDTGFFLFFVMTFFYLQFWLKDKSTNDLSKALLFASLSLLCKGTGILSFALIAFASLYLLLKDKNTMIVLLRPNRTLLLGYLVVLGALSIYFGRIAMYNYTHSEAIKFFANLDDNYGGQAISLSYFFSFDWKNYLQDFGYIDWDERPFWNSFFTAQIYNYCLEPARLIDRHILSISYLGIFLIGCFSAIKAILHRDSNQYLHVMAIICLIGGIILQRSLTMDGHMASGRYVFPVIIMLVSGYGMAITRAIQSRYKILALLLIFNLMAFIALSFIHWVKL